MTQRSRALAVALGAALALASCGSPPAQAQPWEVIVQPGGHKVARGATSGGGAVQGVGLTCKRGVAMIALDLPRAQGRRPVLLSLSDGRSMGKLGVVRTGATTVWAGPVRDPRVLAMLARATSIDVAINGVRQGTVSLAGAAEAMRGVLGGCWAAGATVAITPGTPAASASTSNRAVFADASLPAAVRRDLTDFDQSCAAPEPYNPDSARGGRGMGLAAPGVISKADFNGDGVEDFVLDTRKLRCSREPRSNMSNGGTLFIYTSLADGSIVPSLDAPVDRFAITKGKKAALRIHQNAVEDDVEGNSPEMNETLTMLSATRWSRSQLATPDWRLGALDKYPGEVRSWFGNLDNRCSAAGRRLIRVPESLSAQNMAGDYDPDAPPMRIDFNADGVPDHLVDTTTLHCGTFGVAPKAWPNPCGSNCALVAFVSKPGGGYVVSPVPGPRFESLSGNGDPAYLAQEGKRTVICDSNLRYGWTGVTGQRSIARKGQGCSL